MSRLRKARLAWTTAKHLNRRQIVGQLRHRLRGHLGLNTSSPAQDLAATVPTSWRSPKAFLAPGAQLLTHDQVLDGHFSFLNETRNIGFPPEWRAAGAARLWQYNLHYFHWLWALDYPLGRAAILDWIALHPCDRHAVGWDPYPLSLRVQSWLVWLLGRHPREFSQDDELASTFWPSVEHQVRHLLGNLEEHLGANHLFENATTLCVVGGLVDAEWSAKAARKGESLLERELPRQQLPDGMNYELSPMYHVRMTHVLLLLEASGTDRVRSIVQPALEPALSALALLTHPDGEIALFGDSAFDIEVPPTTILDHAKTRNFGCNLSIDTLGAWALPDAGFCGFRDESGFYAAIDIGPIGPQEQPGHGHADIFSFEVSVGGLRLITDTGVHDYERSAERAYCRSTRAHNTLAIDDQDQAEMWAAFRVGRRPKVSVTTLGCSTDTLLVEATHDGYRHLPGRPIHHRQLTWRAGEHLEIADRVEGNTSLPVSSRIHFEVGVVLRDEARNTYSVWRNGSQAALITIESRAVATIGSSECFPCFGSRETRAALVITPYTRGNQVSYSITPT